MLVGFEVNTELDDLQPMQCEEYPPKVLVVEDDPDTCANLCDILELDNFHVSIACSAEEARTSLASNSVDIVVLDRKLPGGLAEDLLPEFRRSPDTSVIGVLCCCQPHPVLDRESKS